MLGNPFKYADMPELAYPPALGADTEEALTRIAGYSSARIAELSQAGVIRTATAATVSTTQGNAA
ncbi:hypothetical protein D3C81_2323460 [compost metagenome]